MVIKLSSDNVSINISKELYESIKRKIQLKKGRFSSVEEYVEFILRQFVKDGTPDEVYTEEEEKKVMEHLKDLGYI